jgi:hypothetical protein
LETNQLDDKPIKKEATTPEIKIPFTLSKNEAVISFKINKKQKFMKIILAKNEASGLPM